MYDLNNNHNPIQLNTLHITCQNMSPKNRIDSIFQCFTMWRSIFCISNPFFQCIFICYLFQSFIEKCTTILVIMVFYAREEHFTINKWTVVFAICVWNQECKCANEKNFKCKKEGGKISKNKTNIFSTCIILYAKYTQILEKLHTNHQYKFAAGMEQQWKRCKRKTKIFLNSINKLLFTAYQFLMQTK